MYRFNLYVYTCLCLLLLFRPQVYSIRQAAALNLKNLAVAFGADWAQAQIIPQVPSNPNPKPQTPNLVSNQPAVDATQKP